MELAEGALAYAEQIQRSYEQAVLALRIESPLEGAEVAARARAAVGRLGGDEVVWSLDVEPAGAVVRQWGSTPDIGATLRGLARALTDQGLDGQLVPHPPARPRPRSSLLERSEELLECHVRLRGERRRDEHVRLIPDDAALLAGLRAALEWIGRPPEAATLWSSVGDLPHRDAGEVAAHLATRLAAAGAQRWRAAITAWWEAGDRFRLMVWPGNGDLSFAEGGRRLASGDWTPAYEALLDVLRGAAGWSAYGLIKRGRSPAQAGRSLTYDWVPALHYGSYNLHHHPYEDVLAPDAFGAQLLGPGYKGRIPSAPDWERIDAGGSAVLLLHRDPAAWFAEPLPPITPEDSIARDPAYPTPAVILRARRDLAEILATVDTLSRAALD